MSKPQINNDAVTKALKLDNEKTKNAKGETLSKVLEDTSLQSLMGSGAPRATIRTDIVVEANMNWLNQLSQAIHDTAYKYNNQWADALTPELLADYLRWVVLNRVNFLRNGRNIVHPKNLAYPTVMYDALARLTQYDGSVKDGALLEPTVGPAHIDDATLQRLQAWQEHCYNGAEVPENEMFTADSWIDNDRIIAFPGHDNIERLLKVAGVEMATGLPLTRKSTIRTMYEMNVDQNDYVTTAGQVPTVADVFARCFYQFEAIANLVGVQKVELLLYRMLRDKLLDITEGYVKNFRG